MTGEKLNPSTENANSECMGLVDLYRSLIREQCAELKEKVESPFTIFNRIKNMAFPTIIETLEGLCDENNSPLIKEVDESKHFTLFKFKNGQDVFNFANSGIWYTIWEYNEKNELIEERITHYEVGKEKESDKNIQVDTKKSKIEYQNGRKSKEIEEERFTYEKDGILHVTPFWIIKEYLFDERGNKLPRKISKKNNNQDVATGARMGFEGEVNRNVEFNKDKKIIIGTGNNEEIKMFEENFEQQSGEFNQLNKDHEIYREYISDSQSNEFNKFFKKTFEKFNIKEIKWSHFDYNNGASLALGEDKNGNIYEYRQMNSPDNKGTVYTLNIRNADKTAENIYKETIQTKEGESQTTNWHNLLDTEGNPIKCHEIIRKGDHTEKREYNYTISPNGDLLEVEIIVTNDDNSQAIIIDENFQLTSTQDSPNSKWPTRYQTLQGYEIIINNNQEYYKDNLEMFHLQRAIILFNVSKGLF